MHVDWIFSSLQMHMIKYDGIWWYLLDMIRSWCQPFMSENMTLIRQTLTAKWKSKECSGVPMRNISSYSQDEVADYWRLWEVLVMTNSDFPLLASLNMCVNRRFAKNLLCFKAVSQRPFFVYLLYVPGWVYVCPYGLSDVRVEWSYAEISSFLNLSSRWKDKKMWQRHTFEYV